MSQSLIEIMARHIANGVTGLDPDLIVCNGIPQIFAKGFIPHIGNPLWTFYVTEAALALQAIKLYSEKHHFMMPSFLENELLNKE